ncbi:MAG: VWA domain-containing protein [Myxococcota bacterium]|nr:VWA domain-containing protein [Myxococcota bacterium]
MYRPVSLSLSFLTVLLTTGCGNFSTGMGDLGATPGGSQDIGYARQVIESGDVPREGDFTIGGLLNEHDLPIEGAEPCDEILCVYGSTGVGRVVVEDEQSLFVQIGYDTNLSEATFERDPLNLAIVVDISGSMTEVLDDVKVALHSLLDQLEPTDRLAIVTYGSNAQVLLPSTLAEDTDHIARKIDKLSSGGSTAMEAGIEKGFEVLRPHLEDGVASRMMLFTDVQPNVGATEASDFEQVVGEASDEGMGLTLFGIGYSFGYGLALDISELPGGNFYYLAAQEDVEEVFDEDFDYMVTPLAYDLEISLDSPMDFIEAYNIQGTEEAEHTLTARVATIFLSRDSGATVVRLDLPEQMQVALGASVADLRLSYVDRDGHRVDQQVEVQHGNSAGGLDGDAFAQVGTRKSAALVNMGLGMQELCAAFYEGDVELAADAFFEVRDRLEAEAINLENEELMVEVNLLDQLAVNAGL